MGKQKLKIGDLLSNGRPITKIQPAYIGTCPFCGESAIVNQVFCDDEGGCGGHDIIYTYDHNCAEIKALKTNQEAQ